MMRKTMRSSIDCAVVDVWKRQVGELSTRNFAHRLRASEDLVLRFDVFRKLEKHRGCVNTVSFNADGDIVISGSDDRRIILWEWETGKIALSFHSGHHNNVFQAKIMPYTDDRSIVTCAADGQVREAQILEHGKVETKLLAKHQGRAHKLAIEPASPHIIYTCGEDGLVQHIDLRTHTATELFTCQPLRVRRYMSILHLNAITIDPRKPYLFAVGGSDEFARIFDIRKYNWDGSTDFGQPVDYFCPPHLVGDENVGITGLAFSDQSELLVSYNEELIYLFTKDMGLGPDPSSTSPLYNDSDEGEMGQADTSAVDMESGANISPQVYKGHRNSETVKGVNFFGPKCEYVVSGSDCGRIFVWRKKGGDLVRVMEADKDVVNCIESHPHTAVLASSGIEYDIKIWTPKAIERAILPTNIQKGSTPRRLHLFGYGGDEDNGIYFFDDGSDDDYGGSSDNEDEDDSDMDEDEDDFSNGMDDDDDDDDDGFEDLDIHEDGNGDEFFDTVGDPDFDDSLDNDQDSPSDSCYDDDDSNENDIDE
ncbi:DDB1 and CUL4-associated factor 8 [Capsicum chacoense]|uniref:DDB1- and CUL4-associated factor 8 n=1 Tax=Capsicum annuum TaxID=4072 RepID=UPI0007BF22EE|nr:DDB1- and CUL4-associated factor 8 [Capsicum annuum]KAF3642988.1 putative DDB1- and CUL4-associated factor 8-like isoform X2 [Capsicum annuum]